MEDRTKYLEQSDITQLFITSLISGGVAGTVVDSSLFPIDTIKTRLQSEKGFINSGGFKNLYKGLFPVLIGSAPTASVFFIAYESTKFIVEPHVTEKYHSLVHMGAASLAEVAACLIRVPVEVTKQRRQAQLVDKCILELKILYRGFWSTVFRDMPFSLIQFPTWEYSKKLWRTCTKKELLPVEGALCGAVSGGFAAAITTPLDVIKTRIMLANKKLTSDELRIRHIYEIIYRKNGVKGLFAGLGARTVWMTAGGFIFFGAYDKARDLVNKNLYSKSIIL
ncbi:S-adenosylmethionine mitochondrial carrier protein homolog [Prorops nasuta]|uniref:S-adenosylmethionine mitochondrial carrier protein homolog n=1 Tax=Prorops nasuta TaxID=863751 RepID=UPI0034CE2B14